MASVPRDVGSALFPFISDFFPFLWSLRQLAVSWGVTSNKGTALLGRSCGRELTLMDGKAKQQVCCQIPGCGAVIDDTKAFLVRGRQGACSWEPSGPGRGLLTQASKLRGEGQRACTTGAQH